MFTVLTFNYPGELSWNLAASAFNEGEEAWCYHVHRGDCDNDCERCGFCSNYPHSDENFYGVAAKVVQQAKINMFARMLRDRGYVVTRKDAELSPNLDQVPGIEEVAE